MTSPIGNNPLRNKVSPSLRAFTLIEILVTLVILTSGILMIFKTFLISLDRMNYLTNRLYADVILDNNLAYMQRMMRAYKTLPLDLNRSQVVELGAKKIEFDQDIKVEELSEFDRLFNVQLTLSWKEGFKKVNLSRSAYIYDTGSTN